MIFYLLLGREDNALLKVYVLSVKPQRLGEGSHHVQTEGMLTVLDSFLEKLVQLVELISKDALFYIQVWLRILDCLLLVLSFLIIQELELFLSVCK